MDSDDLRSVDALIGIRLKMRRKELGLSQGKLGQAIKVSFQQVQKYERGKNRIPASRLKAISDVLEIPSSYFFDDVDVNMDATNELMSLMDHLSSVDTMRLNLAFMAIKNQKVRRALIHLLDELGYADPKPSA